MEIEHIEEKKIFSVWLTRAESQDENLQRRLKAMYPKWKKNKYLVAVYHSGKEDLFESILALLAYNKNAVLSLLYSEPRSRNPGKQGCRCNKKTNAEEFCFFRIFLLAIFIHIFYRCYL